MPSVFGHVLASTSLGYAFFPAHVQRRPLLLAALCAVAPDADVLTFRLGIPYESIWGHRGWTHSLAFAFLLGWGVGWFFFRHQSHWFRIAFYLGLVTASHPLLDMLTTGGLGCALWWPFSEERLFFPIQVIQVSPLEVGAFLSKWGAKVFLSEVLWIGLPGAALIAIRFFWRGFLNRLCL